MDNQMNEMADRAERLINAIANSLLRTAEVAAQKIELASEVAAVRQRMTAFGAVLETVSVQKQAVHKQLALLGPDDEPTRKLYQHQLQLLTQQEVGILKQAGIDETVSSKAIAMVDTPLTLPAPVPVLNGAVQLPNHTPTPTHSREGRRFLRVRR